MAPRRAAAFTAPTSNDGCTSSGVPVASARVTTPSPLTCDSGRQHNHLSRAGSTPSRLLDAAADAATAARVRTTPRGSPVVPEVATTKASPSSTGRLPVRPVSTPGAVTTAAGRRASKRRALAGAGRRWSTGKTASPASSAAERDDEGLVAR